ALPISCSAFGRGAHWASWAMSGALALVASSQSGKYVSAVWRQRSTLDVVGAGSCLVAVTQLSRGHGQAGGLLDAGGHGLAESTWGDPSQVRLCQDCAECSSYVAPGSPTT